tara:strand:- start:334 stop:951 length:618 start_codon:yes stop_codon:yes gene_type:complete
MKKKIVLILSLFNFFFQENTIIKSFFNNHLNLKSAKFTFRILTTQNNEVKFESNGEFLIKNDSYKILTDDVIYYYNDGFLYSIITDEKEINIYDMSNVEVSNDNILFKSINPKELVIFLKKHYSYELILNPDNKTYTLFFTNDFKPNYEIKFNSKFEIKSIEIINKNSTFNNILFFENIKTDIEINDKEIEININNYKDFFINQL